jgi:hypothetical protein
MQDNIVDRFPKNEKEKRKKLHSIMKDWARKVSKLEIKYRGDRKKYVGIECFGPDGFFPNYYNQKIKVLFVGREARRFELEYDFIERFIREFKTENFNTKIFWRRILKILYGIYMHGEIKFEEIISATEIARIVSAPKELSFAIMNLSKIYNESNDAAKADYKLINNFLKESRLDDRNFFYEEIELLNPNLIITANLWNGKIENEYLNKCFNNPIKIKEGSKANLLEMQLHNKKINIIDVYHFSKPGSDRDYYYNPVMKLYKKIIYRNRKNGT